MIRRALTITDPYAWLIMEGYKGVENRSWAPSVSVIEPGERFAVHSSKKKATRKAIRHAAEVIGSDFDALETMIDEHPKGVILGVVTFVRVLSPGECVDDPVDRPWRDPDAFAFELACPVRIPEPIPIRGILGFWTIPSAHRQELEGQLSRRGGNLRT